MTPEQLNKVAWGINGIMKIIGASFYVKALLDYKKC